YSETDRNFVCSHRVADAARYRVANIFEMRRIAADHRAETNQGIVFTAARHPLQHQWNLKRAWHSHDGQVLFSAAVALEPIDRAVEQLLRDKMIQAADDDADLKPAGILGSFKHV